MLKHIPNILSPDLMKALMEMGHSDQIAIVDGNFPSFPHPKHVVRCDGHGVPELLDAILRFMPLDSYVDNPTFLMQVAPGDSYLPKIWNTYREIGKKHEEKGLREIEVERFAFYEQCKNCYAVVTTSESALYANIILQKGVVVE